MICDKETLGKSLEDFGYPLREDPINVECAINSLRRVVILVGQAKKPARFILCENHFQWVMARENKLADLNVKFARRHVSPITFIQRHDNTRN